MRALVLWPPQSSGEGRAWLSYKAVGGLWRFTYDIGGAVLAGDSRAFRGAGGFLYAQAEVASISS